MQQPANQPLQEANQQLTTLSLQTAWTGLYNRGYRLPSNNEFNRYHCTGHVSTPNDAGHRFFQESKRYLRPSRLAMKYYATSASCDIQCAVLTCLDDMVGEEFGVLLTDINESITPYIAERLRQSMEKEVVTFDGHEIRFTISIGLAGKSVLSKQSALHWLQKADAALYHS